ncbi:hypothetical protein Golax_010593 [Gossypium laxum]|uniref:Uncharacterized protein n=1 Tax=Gossypium laxum TaxID=34288 RepID=A0A7J8ZI73_9ROSI|nr:hypothetical protein [Gossypium laxum]
MNITGMTHPGTKKKVDVFALSIYSLVVFPKALGHVDEAVTDLGRCLQIAPINMVPRLLLES